MRKLGFGSFLGIVGIHLVENRKQMLVASIVFISFGVVAAFCCAIVDGVFAARHIRDLYTHFCLSTEETVCSFGVKQDTTAAQLHEVSLTCAELTAKIGQLEDMARQRYLKIREISNAIDAGEIPQFIRRLFSTTLTPKQAKGTLLDGIYCLPGSLTNKPSGLRDVIVCFRSRTDKDTFMAQVKGQSPFIFEQHSLCFFQDLRRSTLQWHATLKEVTSQLRTADIQYRWGTPRALVAERNGKRHRLTSVSNSDSFLQSM
ncbi:transmembrane 255B [Pelobates cultripes]|uniref:Transmembrane 255B, partial n=1 Tax=Pelobates cultripes TaxID=61616 RepID=A0AAD1R4F3_PELCU|nr:transmembrane 255B [Pelobates cultripes]